MSHVATNWAFQQRGIKPSAKLLLLALADCHNPAHGCFPTQEFLADACQIGRATVNRQLTQLEAGGLIRRVRSIDPKSKRQRPTRYKLAFEDDFGTPEPSMRTKRGVKSGSKGGNHKENLMGSQTEKHPQNAEKAVSQNDAKPCLKNAQSRVSKRDTNLVKKSVKEHCVDGTATTLNSEAFEEFWKSYPRPKNRDRTAKLFSDAIEAGTSADTIVRAAARYRAENIGNNPQYVAFSDNWLDRKRWEDFAADIAPSARDCGKGDLAAFWAVRVKARRYIAPSAIGPLVASEMIDRGLVNESDLIRAGVRV